MKIYVKEIKACTDCPDNSHNTHCHLSDKEIPPIYIKIGEIPEWCMLEDIKTNKS